MLVGKTDKMSVTLLVSCMFDIRDSLLLEAEIQNFKEGSCMGGFGPNQEQIQKRKIERLLEAGEKFGKEIKKHGVSLTASQTIQKRTNEEDTGNQNIKKKKLMDAKLHKRLSSAIEQENCITVQKSITKNNSKHTYHVSSSSKGKVTYQVDICCSSSCTCPDYQKNGKEVYCKHILFLLKFVMQADESLFKEKYISHGDIEKLMKPIKKEASKVFLKLCVHYFLSKFSFTLNDSSSKIMKNVFYFI